MTVILELTPEVQARLRHNAERAGKDIGTYLLSVAEREGQAEDEAETARLRAQREKNQAALDMLKEWDEEDKTDDPQEIARRVAEWDEFKKGMNAAHSSSRVIYP